MHRGQIVEDFEFGHCGRTAILDDVNHLSRLSARSRSVIFTSTSPAERS